MLTKVLAAKARARSGASTVIASGREPDVLTRLAAGEDIGSALVADAGSLAARKQWLADHVQSPAGCGSTPARRARSPATASLLRSGWSRSREHSSAARSSAASTRRPRDRARPRQLQRRGSGAHPARPSSEIEAVLGYVDRARAHPSRQHGPAGLTAALLG